MHWELYRVLDLDGLTTMLLLDFQCKKNLCGKQKNAFISSIFEQMTLLSRFFLVNQNHIAWPVLSKSQTNSYIYDQIIF